MNDYLQFRMNDAEIAKLSVLALAHIGDCVYEMLTRSYLLSQGLSTARNLHFQTVQRVRAVAQFEAAHKIAPLLTEDEQTVFRRARNTRHKSVPKGASPVAYAHATAVEALFGWLWLKGESDRINQLYDVILHAPVPAIEKEQAPI